MRTLTRCGFSSIAVFAVAAVAISCCLAEQRSADAAPLAKGNSRPRVESSGFGKMPDGTAVDLYTLTNARGLQAKVISYGATLIGVNAPDRNGKFENVTLYLDSFDDYLRGHPFFGSVVGRYANRIAAARFQIDGVEYKLTANSGANHIHGGKEGFQRAVWKAEPLREGDAVGVKLTHLSPDGEAGYPGTLEATVTYKLTGNDELILDYTARTDKPTHVNLTNHAYWNLAGAGSGDVLRHVLMLNADGYLPTDKTKIPLGEIKSVEATPMDFRQPQTIGSRIEEVEDRNYDHCYVLSKQPGERLSLAARLVEPGSGRVMEVQTTQPGVQLYTAKGLSSKLRAGGKSYGPYHGVCLETQHFPDSPNRPAFPSTVLRPGQTYHEITIYKFSIR
jgi:aldose 1-epimerase